MLSCSSSVTTALASENPCLIPTADDSPNRDRTHSPYNYFSKKDNATASPITAKKLAVIDSWIGEVTRDTKRLGLERCRHRPRYETPHFAVRLARGCSNTRKPSDT